MSLTQTQARDELNAIVTAAWKADPVAQAYKLVYDDVEAPPPSNSPWARVNVLHNSGRQASLAGALGQQRYLRLGILIIQIFSPINDGMKMNDKLVQLTLNALEGKTTPGGIWFRNVGSREAPRSGAFTQTNVVAEFEYDEVK